MKKNELINLKIKRKKMKLNFSFCFASKGEKWKWRRRLFFINNIKFISSVGDMIWLHPLIVIFIALFNFYLRIFSSFHCQFETGKWAQKTRRENKMLSFVSVFICFCFYSCFVCVLFPLSFYHLFVCLFICANAFLFSWNELRINKIEH